MPRSLLLPAARAVPVVLSLASCVPPAVTPMPPAGGRVQSITLTSKAFAPNATIPVDYTCDGKDTSPPLVWSAPPEGTRSLAVVLDEPDATKQTTDWILFNIPATATGLPEGGEMAGAALGANDAPDVRYGGPCPPRGEMRRYSYRVFALDAQLTIPEGSRRPALDRAMDGHLIGEGSLTGRVAR